MRIERDCGREVGSTRIMAAIESAVGVINAVAIARRSPRLIGIALAAFDYVMDMQTERSDGTELFYALRGTACRPGSRYRCLRRGVVRCERRSRIPARSRVDPQNGL